MLDINKTISISGTSTIEVIENGNKVQKQVAYMNTDISKDGALPINKIIQERELFSKHFNDVIADFNEFENYVYELLKGSKNE